MDKIILNEGYQNKSLLFSHGKDDLIFTSKKKSFYDLSYSAGTLILGHNSKIFKKSLKLINKKNLSLFAHPNIHAKEFSKTIKKLFPSFSKIIFCNTGSEAVLKSLRISRSLNNKHKIVSVSGSWHGSVDKLLYQPKKNLQPTEISAGLEKIDKKNLIFIPYNDLAKSKKILEKNKKKINCVIIEPIQGSLPVTTAKSYLKYLSSFCKKNNCNLIFDEIISGVRVDKYSVHKKYKIYPDIVTIGKIVGGGLPIGVIGISKSIEKKIVNSNKKIFFGGTFSGNCLSAFIGNETLKYLYKKKNIFKKINNYSKQFQNEVNEYIRLHKIDAKIFRFDSILRIIFSRKRIDNRVQRDFFEKKNINKISLFRNFLLKKKIYYPTSGIIFFSDATSKKSLSYITKYIKIGLKKYF